jgi:hypothetical protein
MADDGDDRLKVFLGIPHSHSVLPSTIRTVLECTLEPQLIRLTLADAGGSLLCRNFNHLWALALNERQRSGVDIFAMLHADIQAQAGWLDLLVGELLRLDADVISAVVPIKDSRGLTSTGFSDPEDPRVERLAVRELQSLPRTFDALGAGRDGK